MGQIRCEKQGREQTKWENSLSFNHWYLHQLLNINMDILPLCARARARALTHTHTHTHTHNTHTLQTQIPILAEGSGLEIQTWKSSANGLQTWRRCPHPRREGPQPWRPTRITPGWLGMIQLLKNRPRKPHLHEDKNHHYCLFFLSSL